MELFLSVILTLLFVFEHESNDDVSPSKAPDDLFDLAISFLGTTHLLLAVTQRYLNYWEIPYYS